MNAWVRVRLRANTIIAPNGSIAGFEFDSATMDIETGKSISSDQLNTS